MENSNQKPKANISMNPTLAWILSLFVGFSFIFLLYEMTYGRLLLNERFSVANIILFLGGVANTYMWFFITNSLKKRNNGIMNNVWMWIVVAIH